MYFYVNEIIMLSVTLLKFKLLEERVSG